MGGRLGFFWDLGVPEGPARLTCLPALPLCTQWPFLQPYPHWLGLASQCCLCAGEGDLSGWGVGSLPHRAFVSSQRDRLPQLLLELPPAGFRCTPALAKAASPTFPPQRPLVPEASEKSQV